MSQSDITFNILTAEKLANKTHDAYSFDYYGEAEWLKIVQFLFGKGYNEEDVEQIVRSKHTRWASDSSREVDADAIDFVNHFQKYENGINEMLGG